MRNLVLATALWAGTAAAGGEADLIQQLGSGDYRTREVAHQKLATTLDAKTISLLLKAEKSTNVELSRRATELLKPHRERLRQKEIDERFEKLRTKYEGKFPWINDRAIHSSIHREYFQMAKGATTGPDWPKHRNATELLILNLLRQGYVVENLLEKLKADELRWIDLNNRYSADKIPPTWKDAPAATGEQKH